LREPVTPGAAEKRGVNEAGPLGFFILPPIPLVIPAREPGRNSSLRRSRDRSFRHAINPACSLVLPSAPTIYNHGSVDIARIAELLHPFLKLPLADAQLEQISTYIDLLLHWNRRINLTAVRGPEEVVTRHFGESLFLAQRLFPAARMLDATSSVAPAPEPPGGQGPTDSDAASCQDSSVCLLDIGSGAGFPGLPIKICFPPARVTLVESRQKKVAFLREVVRALTLTNVDVFPGRAEDFPPASAQIVTLRAVERFDRVLPVAAARLAPTGLLALLIGIAQLDRARRLLPGLDWLPPTPIPGSSARTLFLGLNRVIN